MKQYPNFQNNPQQQEQGNQPQQNPQPLVYQMQVNNQQQMINPPQNNYPQQMVYPPQNNVQQQQFVYPVKQQPVYSPIYSNQQTFSQQPNDFSKNQQQVAYPVIENSPPKQKKYQLENENQQQIVQYIGPSLFSDDVTRRGFIKKVLSIICLQLVVTAIFVLAAVVSEGYRDFVKENSWLIVICILINFITLIALYCFRNVCKEVPKNYILLGFYTVAESYLLSCLCSVVSPGIILMAFLILIAIVVSLITYSIKTQTDITQKITFFIYAPIAVIVIIIIASAFTSYIVQTIVSLIIIGLFSAYLVFDIQRLTNPKKNSYTYTVDDYIIAALDIYIDIIMIFKELIIMLAR